MQQRNYYVYQRPSNFQQRQSLMQVPILKPEQIEKLDHLKKIINNPENHQVHRGRESIRPSKGSYRPSKSLKLAAHHHLPKNAIQRQKQIYNKDKSDSGFTKQLTLRTNQLQNSNSKRRLNKPHVQYEQQGILDKCCGLFSREQRTTESPFKAARQVNSKK